jgi:hypothetical protein
VNGRGVLVVFEFPDALFEQDLNLSLARVLGGGRLTGLRSRAKN